MAFYYCKSGGTATGDGGRYASEKSNNSWATEFTATSEYYDSAESAVEVSTTSPTNSDVIYVSSASTFSKGTNIQFDLSPAPTNPVQIYSVDDSAVQEYLAGATEDTGGAGSDLSVNTVGLKIFYNGITTTITDDLFPIAVDSGFIFNDSTISFSGSGDRVFLAVDGCVVNLNNTDLISVAGTTSQLVFVSNGCLFEMVGGSITATSSTLNDFVAEGFTNGGGSVRVTGTDLSDFGSGTFLLGRVGASVSTDDFIDMRVHACMLNASVDFVEEQFSSINHSFLMTNSSSSSAAAEYQFYQRTWAGDVEDDSGTYRDESTAFPSGTQVSMKVTTVPECSKGRPLIVDLLTTFAELSNASTDTLRIYFTCANTLTDSEVWAEAHYPDGTTKQLYNVVSNRNTDILAAGTTHTTDGASTWTAGLTNKYQMDLDTSGDAGADSVPIIRVYVAVASETIYFDTTVEVVA